MRRFISCCLIAVAVIGSSFAMTGCVVVPPRGHVRVWVPGYGGPSHIWVGGHYRYR